MVQPPDDLLHRLVKVAGGREHIGHIQGGLAVLASVGQAQHAPQNLLHIHRAGLVCDGGQDVGKGAVPALFQRIDGDDIANGAALRQQINIFQLVDVRSTDSNLLLGNPRVHQLVP